MEVEVEGLAELYTELEKFPRVVVNRCYREALNAAVEPILEALARLTPVVTGELLQHLTFVIQIYPDGSGGVAHIGFGDAGWIARLVEFGHRQVGHAPDYKELGEVKPHPFITQAFELSGDIAAEALIERLRELTNAQIVIVDKTA